jgi:hypothetical protein
LAHGARKSVALTSRRSLRELFGFLTDVIDSETVQARTMTKSASPPWIGTAEAPLPAERAFVVQFRSQAEAGGELFVGRAEHIASGAVERFASAQALIAFIAKVLAPPEVLP